MPAENKLKPWNMCQPAWSTIGADERRAPLAKSVVDGCVYSDGRLTPMTGLLELKQS